MFIRLLQWAIRLPMIPQGHAPDCVFDHGCRCEIRKLRAPRFLEAVKGFQ